ncbi:MAG: hypothetical protein FRX49_04114 [Trebouxia sp. A1-2]|nr:MAG: hypothetical protein FRX49_04114 [Trebouxia sp. A1-2]
MSLEPVKVFQDLTNKIAATKVHFEEYSAGVSKLLKLKRALLHWTLMAVKLLKRSYVSEHLQIRYRTARMLEIWDLAASSIPASPVRSLAVASQPDLMFPMLSTSNAAERSSDGTASASATAVQPAASTPTPMRQRDVPLLQINPAQLSRSNSHITASPKDIQSGPVLSQAPESNSGSLSISGSQADNSLSGVSIPSASSIAADTKRAFESGMAAVGSSGSDTAAALHDIKSQGSDTRNLLAAVNAVVGGLSLRHTANLSGGAALSPITEQSEASSGTVSGASTSRQQQSEQVAAAVAAPDIFLGMAAAGFRRTRSNLRTGGSLTASTAADLPRVASLSSNAPNQLSRQTSRGMQQTVNGKQGAANHLISGLSGGTMNTDDVDWRS